MPEFIQKLINNRVTVSFVLLIMFMFVVLPVAFFIDIHWLMGPNDETRAMSIPTLLIILSYSIIVLAWHIGSSFLKEKLTSQPKIEEKENDFIEDYMKGGFEVWADAATFGFVKYIGYKRFKTLFACHAVAGVFIILLTVLIIIIDSEMLTPQFVLLIWPLTYISTMLIGYPIIKKRLK